MLNYILISAGFICIAGLLEKILKIVKKIEIWVEDISEYQRGLKSD